MRRPSAFGLRSRLTVLVVLCMLPAQYLIIHGNLEDRKTRTEIVRLQAMNLVRMVAHEQDHLIVSTRDMLAALARLPQVQNVDPKRCPALLADLKKEYPFLANLGVAGPGGRGLCSALPMTRPVSYTDREWFQRVVQTRRFTMGDYIIGHITKRPIIALAYPVLDEKDSLKGVIYAGLDLDWLNHLLAETELPPGSTLTVIDRKGTVLCSYPDPDKWVGQDMAERPLAQDVLARKGAGTIENTGLDGVRRLYAFDRMSNKPEVGAHVFVGIPASVAFAETNRILYRNLVLLGIVVILSLTAVWWSSHVFVLQPMEQLLRVIKQVSQGQNSVRAGPPYMGGEIGQLAISFDEMAESLRQRGEERQRAEEALLISETRYRRLFESARDGILIIDADTGQIIDANPFMHDLLGYSCEEFVGKRLWDIGPFKDIAASKISFDELQNAGYIRYENLPLETSHGRHIHVEFVSNVYMVDSKRVIQCNIRDITARKQAEETLNGEIRAMTQQLWQAAKLATMGELAASIAHELNNPLATVGLRVELLQEQVPPEDPKRKALEVIGEEVERMGTLVANLLEFSRRRHSQVSTVDVSGEVDKTLELIHYHLKKRNIQVQRDIGPDVPSVHADRQQLRQLFLNLFTNASDAMPAGGTLTVRVTAGGRGAEGGERTTEGESGPGHEHECFVVIDVVDTGEGIAPENLPKVFDPFFTTKPEGKGTGLGLAICRRIAQENRGTLDIESTSGKGTTVHIVLPIDHVMETACLRET